MVAFAAMDAASSFSSAVAAASCSASCNLWRNSSVCAPAKSAAPSKPATLPSNDATSFFDSLSSNVVCECSISTNFNRSRDASSSDERCVVSTPDISFTIKALFASASASLVSRNCSSVSSSLPSRSVTFFDADSCASSASESLR